MSEPVRAKKRFWVPRASMVGRRLRPWAFAALVLLALAYGWFWATYPSDRTPEGAYLRVVAAVNRAEPEAFFAYIEESAQHACYTIRDYRKRALADIEESYPEPERSEWIARYQPLGKAPDGADVFGIYARQLGWLDRLRRDMTGIDHVEISDERATVQTVQGTRYPFRRRPNGIWGMTLFTAVLSSEAEKAARDASLIEQAARDYRRAAERGVRPEEPVGRVKADHDSR